ncbi:MAG: hypothetical protein ACRD0X_04470, partial [Thermoanaerobaculia bacterium]
MPAADVHHPATGSSAILRAAAAVPAAALVVCCAACTARPADDVLATWRGGEARAADFEVFVQELPEGQRR